MQVVDNPLNHGTVLPVRTLEGLERVTLFCQVGRSQNGVVSDLADIVTPDLHCLFGVVRHALFNKIAVQVHLSQANSASRCVASLNRRRGREIAVCCDVRQKLDSVVHGLRKGLRVRLLHLCDVQ